MARAPRTIDVEPADPFAVVADSETEREASEFAETLDALKNVTDNTSKIIVYKVRQQGGKWAVCKEIYPPVDTATLFDELKREFGAGDYKFRIFAGGRIRNTLSMSIEASISDKLPAPIQPGGMGSDIIGMIMQQSQSAAQQQQNMMTMFMQQQQAAQAAAEARAAANMNNLIALAGIVAPLVLGNKDTPASMIGALAPLLKSDNKNDLATMLPAIAAMKELFAGDGGGGEDSLIGSAAKSLLPMLAGAMQQPPQPVPEPPQQRQMLPSPGPRPAIPVEHARSQEDDLLSLVASDLLFYSRRKFDPELAGDCVIETLKNKGITRDALQLFAATLVQSGNYWEPLKQRGFDFSGHEAFFNAVVNYVSENYPDDIGASDDTGRDAGSESNLV